MIPEHVKRAAALLVDWDELTRLHASLKKNDYDDIAMITLTSALGGDRFDLPTEAIGRMAINELRRYHDELTRLGVTHLGTLPFHEIIEEIDITNAPPPPDMNARVKQGGLAKEGNSL